MAIVNQKSEKSEFPFFEDFKDRSKAPAPHRFIDEVGGAFFTGCVGGFLWNFAKGKILWRKKFKV